MMMRHNAARSRHRRKKLFSLSALSVLLILALGAAFLYTRTPSLPDRVQSEIPEWVEQQLLIKNPYSRPGTPVREVNAIVIHYVGNPNTSAKANRSYFQNLAFSRETRASSNFIVGLDGEILQCVPVNEVAYCSNDRNGDTVSIEVCHPDESGEFSAVTMESVVRLTAWLCHAFELTEEDIIRHYDVSGKECPRYYVRNGEAWDALKTAVAAQLEEL